MASNAGQGKAYVVPAIINNADTFFGDAFPVYAPASSEQIYECTSASASDALNAVSAAQNAFGGWRNTKPGTRRAIFLKVAEVVERRGDELGRYMAEETGAPESWGAGFNVPVAVDMLRDIAGRITSIQGSVPIIAAEGKSAMVLREPYGVILGIAPW